MLPCSKCAVILCLLQVLCITADIGTYPWSSFLSTQLGRVIGLFCHIKLFCSAPDTGSFLIYNENHNKCIKAESATSMTVATCDPRAKEQQFRWASESRILSLSLKLCMGTTEIKDWVKVVLFECDESNNLQHWQCKNETLFGLKDQDLHLNWGNRGERNIMIYKGSGLWSRWRIFGTRGDLCSKGYQGRNYGHTTDFKRPEVHTENLNCAAVLDRCLRDYSIPPSHAPSLLYVRSIIKNTFLTCNAKISNLWE